MSPRKYLLFPFSLIYDMVTRLRNHLYAIGYKKSFAFDTTVLSVGNLSVGGTGKTPMVEYLLRLLQGQYRLCTLSRGYGRRTRGFRLATPKDNAGTLGDEPFQFYRKFGPKIRVAVGEERALAIPGILLEHPDNEIVILDDAYQHRSVIPNLSILLTDYAVPFFEDYLLPMGRLREARAGATRADMLIITKCPGELSEKIMFRYSQAAKKYLSKEAEVYFTTIKYSRPQTLNHEREGVFDNNVFLFSGIANTDGLRKYVQREYNLIDSVVFNDHHRYTQGDIDTLKERWQSHAMPNSCFLTTEKDIVKLIDMDFGNIPLFYLPIEVVFLKNGKAFDKSVRQAVSQ